MDKIAILGLGRTARAAAAYLMERGRQVTLWGRSAQALQTLEREGLEVTGACAGHYAPAVEADLARAVAGARVVLVMTLAAGHAPIAERLRGMLEPGQILLIFNGNWGAYEFFQRLGGEAEEKGAAIAETGAQLFLADYEGGATHIKRVKEEIALAAVRPEQAGELCRALGDVFPQFVPAENVISTSLNSSNPILHAPIALFNITRMENGEDFLFYADGATEMVLSAVERADAERCAVTRAAGAAPVRGVDILNSFWPEKYDTLYEAVKNNRAYQTGRGPKSLRHRYLEEDLPFGMAPVALLGRLYGVETPCVDAMLACYQWLTGADYLAQAPRFEAETLARLAGG